MSGTSMSDAVCTVIVHYQTPDLLTTAVDSFRAFYPDRALLIVDNGSLDGSRTVVERFRERQNTRVLLLNRNIYHGPAMHAAMTASEEPFVFYLDSDTETKRGGFLEAMEEELRPSERIYCAGRKQIVNERGFKASSGIAVYVPAYLMVRRSLYATLPPFEHHGMPVLKNFAAAAKAGYDCREFPIETYIDHCWRGTASRFGYGLGLKGKWDFLLNKIGL